MPRPSAARGGGAAAAGGTHLNGYALTFGAFGDPGDVLEMEMTKRPVQ